MPALPSVTAKCYPSFSEQQVHDLFNIVHSVVQQYFASSNQPSPNQLTSASTPPPSTPSAPQETQKEEDEQLLQQATVESTTESTTESATTHGSSVPDSKSTLSAIPRLCTAHSAACLSNTLLLACLPGYTLPGYTLLGYIEHSKGLEATGQG